MSTITTINSGDLITNSRTDINNNFANLNAGKIETSYLDNDTALTADSDSKIATQKAVKAYVDAGGTASITALRVLPYIFPVGAIYTATVSTNPVTLLGFGTWSAFGAGRVLVGVGTGTVVSTVASRASDVITATGLSDTGSNEFQTGQAVLYSAPSGAMAGLTHNTTYYLVRTGNLTFSLASSLNNAQAGIVISLSSDGTGTQTFTKTLTARTAGETGGEENHAMSSTELLAHSHTINGKTQFSGGSPGAGATNNTFGTPTISNTGGNAAMNNMQPFITVYMWQRTA